MNCPSCQQLLPNDSIFCQYCGCNIEEKRAEAAQCIKKSELSSPYTSQFKQGDFICLDCQHALPTDSITCNFCGSQNIGYISTKKVDSIILRQKKKHLFFPILCCIAIIGLSYFCIVQNNQIGNLDKKIENLQSTAKIMASQNQEYLAKIVNYNKIVGYLKSQKIYRSFYCDKYVLFNPSNEAVQVTWLNDVSTTFYISEDDEVYCEWSQEDWVGTTTVYITSSKKGVYFANITNDYNDKVIRLMIINN